MKKLRVLIACEESGIVRDAFAERGHDAWSCDILPSERPGQHIIDDVLKVLFGEPVKIKSNRTLAHMRTFKEWDLMIAHPPCTFLSNSGVRWLFKKGKRWKADGSQNTTNGKRWQDMMRASKFFETLYLSPIQSICIENPIQHGHAKKIHGCGGPTQIIQPWQFGHGETKATCLWLKNLPPLKPTKIVNGRAALIHRMPPGPDRAKMRSRTYQGIADAMAEQWG